jgi:hypothetical protein
MPPTRSPSQEYLPDEAAVALCLYGEELEPEEVSLLLQASPTHAHRKGDRKELRSPPSRQGAWVLEVRRFEPISLDSMLEELFSPLPTSEAVWQRLTSRFQVRIDIAVDTDVGFTLALSPKSMQLIVSRRAEVQLSVQAYGDNGA